MSAADSGKLRFLLVCLRQTMTRMERGFTMDKTTIMFDSSKPQRTNREIIEAVYQALEEKDYNAIDQLVGYIISGDPSYITSYNNARTMIKSIDRDDLLEELLRYYLKK